MLLFACVQDDPVTETTASSEERTDVATDSPAEPDGKDAAAGSPGAGDLFIGHSDPAKSFDTTYRSVRFYDRALTAEEVAANAKVDGYGVAAE